MSLGKGKVVKALGGMIVLATVSCVVCLVGAMVIGNVDLGARLAGVVVWTGIEDMVAVVEVCRIIGLVVTGKISRGASVVVGVSHSQTPQS